MREEDLAIVRVGEPVVVVTPESAQVLAIHMHEACRVDISQIILLHHPLQPDLDVLTTPGNWVCRNIRWIDWLSTA